jgi:hypothetical protein
MRTIQYTSSSFTTDSSGVTRVVPLTDQAFGFAVNGVEAKVGSGAWFPVNQLPFSYLVGSDNDTGEGTPFAYAMQGNDIYLYPKPSSDTTVKVRYQYRPPKLVKSQGRITSFDSDNETVTLDSLGSSLSTSVDNLTAFVNIVDHLTGEIKATVQISGITTASNTLQLKTSSLDRSEVFGYTTSTALPSNISKDDYVCLASGTCVPYLSSDLTNFLVELAGFYTKRKLDIVSNADFEDRREIFAEINSMQFGREHTKKIQRSAYSRGSITGFFRGGK